MAGASTVTPDQARTMIPTMTASTPQQNQGVDRD